MIGSTPFLQAPFVPSGRGIKQPADCRCRLKKEAFLIPARKTAAPRKAALRTSETILELVTHSLDADKAEEITVLDLRGKSSIADYMVIASGRSSRHLGSMAQHLQEKLGSRKISGVAIEGATQGDWVLVDGGDIIVQLFRPEIRAFYNLEKMWGAGLQEEISAAE